MNVPPDLLNDWQHGFPLCARPYAELARVTGLAEAEVMQTLRGALADGRVSRIGGVFAPEAGGAALLVAMAVPQPRIEAVAARVSAHPGVNHNYLREHPLNLWFVITGSDVAAVESGVAELESACGLPALRLPRVRPYRVDLGFDLHRSPDDGAAQQKPQRSASTPIPASEWPLARCAEAGLPVVDRPYAAWADEIGWSEAQVIARLQAWLDAGQLKRFGVVVRHHQLGWAANAMVVWDVPDGAVNACGLALADQPGVTLAYRRARAAGWPYNLYAMVHGAQRDAAQAVIERATCAAGLTPYSRAVLFSTRCFKQTGARRFRGWDATSATAPQHEMSHAYT
ncbi:MAG: Lrp/AsnC family transcriptional regulator [Burkholderiaceae bacterium]|jgi:DNA-binding Lrp family transcriptional regulator|nr:Lrp/AsnC family transcriptional regulator [Burkholderiaceae bacterium]